MKVALFFDGGNISSYLDVFNEKRMTPHPSLAKLVPPSPAGEGIGMNALFYNQV